MHLTPSESRLTLADGTVLEIHQVVRTVPDKRCVCRGEWQNQPVFAKLFFGKKNQYYAKRDADGVKALLNAHILTPALLLKSASQDGKAEVLVFSALAPAENCEVLWQNSQPAERLTLAKKLCQTIAKHHAANLLQTDLYLKNFLYFQQDVVTLDGDGIRKFEVLTAQQALENFAVLLSKMDVLDVEDWAEMLLGSYAEVNQCFSFDLPTLKKWSVFYRTQAAEKYAKKVFRTCTDVQVQRVSEDFIAIARPYVEVLPSVEIRHLDQAMQTAKTLKNGTTCTVALADFLGHQVVVKRYNIKHVGHFFWRMLRKTRAANSWANAHRLTLLSIPTALPIALVEQRHGGLSGKAYFLADFLDAPDIQQFFKHSTGKAARAAVIKNTVQLFYRLFLLKISHGDFKANNIKIADDKPVLIDLDSMRQHHLSFFAQKAHVRDLKRFMQNWKGDTSLYNAFLKTFKVVYKDHAVLKKAHLLIED